MKRVLVTGATGLLGANTVLALLESGYHVNAFVRRKSKVVLNKHPALSIYEGDFNVVSDLEKAMIDCTFLVHAAAETGQAHSGKKAYVESNINFTKKLYEVAINFGIKRLVHVSTSNVFGFGNLHQLGDELTPIQKPFSQSHYVKSKLAGQEWALSLPESIEVVIVNPTFMIGPLDQKPSSGKIIFHGFKKRVAFYPPGGKNFIDVRDAALGIVAALEIGGDRESYVLAGENLSYFSFFDKIRHNSPYNPRLIKIPKFILLTMGILGDFFRRFGLKTSISLTNMQILCVENYYSNGKARRTLGLATRPIDQSINDAIAWFRSNGKIPQ
jgi:nucleoside-diphosphate-sugar epimerase